MRLMPRPSAYRAAAARARRWRLTRAAPVKGSARALCGGLLVAAVALPALRAGAAAYGATLCPSEPGPAQVMLTSPATTDLYTSSPLAPPDANVIQVQTKDLSEVDRRDTTVDRADARHLVVSLESSLAAGRYVVSLVAVSAAGGQIDRGQFSFYVVSRPSPTALPTPASV